MKEPLLTDEKYWKDNKLNKEHHASDLASYLFNLQKQNRDLKHVLGVIMAEINSTPMAVQYFDLRIIKEANELIK